MLGKSVRSMKISKAAKKQQVKIVSPPILSVPVISAQ